MKKNFKLISLLTVLTVVVNVLSVLVLMKPASALTAATDTLSRLQATTAATHTIAFTTTGTGAVITIPAGFTGTAAVTSPAECTPSGNVITCVGLTAGAQSVVVTGLTNPAVGSYSVTVAADSSTATIIVPVVDSDQVLVNGYITSSMVFDLDTGTDNNNCSFDGCLIHSGGASGANYTVDLGELTTLAVNGSGDTVMHSDTNSGMINWIYFDLSTNAAGGAVVTMQSVGTLPGYLDGPGSGTQDIPGTGGTLVAGTANYGFKYASAPTSGVMGTGGVVTIPAACEDVDSTYCAIPTTPTSVYAVSSSVQAARGQIELAAAIDGTMVPGTYNDVLQFIATATY